MLNDAAVFVGRVVSQAYTCEDGRYIKRAPSDGDYGQWELHDASGQVIDTDQFRHDLADRHNIELTGWAD